MGWLNRGGSDRSSVSTEPSDPAVVERSSLGIATLLDVVGSGSGRSLLDVGRANPSAFEIYRRFASRIRFADLLRPAAAPEGARMSGDAIPGQSDAPYDLVLLWDLLDRVEAGSRADIMERVVARSRPGARLLLLANGSGAARVPTWDFTVTALDRIRYDPSGPDRVLDSPMLPAEVERVLRPFEVVRAFVSRSGMREYVATLR